MRNKPVPGIERSRPLAETNVRLLAEWEQQDAILLIWPHSGHGWQTNIAAAETVFIELVTAISQYQPVLLIVQDDDHLKAVTKRLKTGCIIFDRVRLITIRTDDCWARDVGPISILDNGQPKLLDFQFNGWGKKYSFANDNRINIAMKKASVLSCPLQSIPLILEGGSIETDGHGTLLTTRSCLLSATRNSSYDQNKIEQLLKRFLGIKNIHWLNHGAIAGDDTDGHIDTLARFCPDNTIVYSSCDDIADIHFQPLQNMQQELTQITNCDGQSYKLIALPLPAAIVNDQGKRLPANYTNFQIVNGAVLYPLYDDPMDVLAGERLRQAFPEHEIIGINARPLIEQYGSVHCLCMSLMQGSYNNS